jgi:hypothetical protein
VIDDGRRIDREAFEQGHAAEIEVRLTRPLAEHEVHALGTAFAVAHTLGVLRQLARIPAYLKQYSRTPALAAVGATRASDLVYHLEGFLIRTTTLRDRVLHLCSAVCHTGLAANAVNQRSIAGNSIVKSNGIDENLKTFDRLCGRYSQARNQVAHEHGLLDADIRLIEGVLLASRILPAPQRSAAASHYRRLVGEVSATKADEVDAFARSAIGGAGELFVALERVYRLKQDQLRCQNA